MKKISEMSLEELRDYALAQDQKLAAATKREGELNTQITELTASNQDLRARNNKLFAQVEQQTVTPEKEEAEQPAPVESCEDIGAKIARGEI